MPKTVSGLKWVGITVCGAVIVAGVSLGIDFLVDEGLVRGVSRWVWAFLTSIWRFLLSDILVPMWLAITVSVVALVVAVSVIILTVVIAYISERRQPWHAYTEAQIEGMVCRWKWSRSDEIWNLSFFCPMCDGELVSGNNHGFGATYFVCEKCSEQQRQPKIFPEDPRRHNYDIVERIKREIRRHVRTGEWRSGT